MKKAKDRARSFPLPRQIARQVLPGLLAAIAIAAALLVIGNHVVSRMEAAIDAAGAKVFASVVLLQATRPACPQQKSSFHYIGEIQYE